ncbi:Beta-lactamase domain-containing protein [Mycena kentingensis (nom. inval.)]|nr:Beta-lactamase domain-containing protein [Mycena kentingensis (nom. inval.)]
MTATTFDSNEALHAYLTQLILPPHLRGETNVVSQEILAGYNVPGLSVAFLPRAKDLDEYAQTSAQTATFGLRDAKDASSAVDSETLFEAASISKPFTALAVLRLVAQGKLDLDADIAQYLALDESNEVTRDALHQSSLTDASNTPQTPITLRLLLAHRSGLSTVSGFAGYSAPLTTIPSTVASLNGASPANHRPIRAFTLPGLGTSYSGGGTTLLQHILSLVTHGKPFPQLMEELVLAPLGMARSTYIQHEPDANYAVGHTTAEQGYPGTRGMGVVYPEMAAAGLRTTPSDNLRGLRKVYDCLLGANDFLPHALVAEAFTESGGWGGFGVGWQLDTLSTDEAAGTRHVVISHGGSNQGFRCMFALVGDVPIDFGAPLKSPKPPVAFAAMTNSDYGAHIVSSVAAAFGWLAEEPTKGSVKLYFPALARTPEELDLVAKRTDGWREWVGKWQVKKEGEDVTLEVIELESGPGLRVSTLGAAADVVVLLPAARYDPNTIFWTVRNMEVAVGFKKAKEGEEIALEVHQNGESYVAGKTS